MSRGIGSRQRHILDRLAAGGDGLVALSAWEVEPGYVSSYALAHSIRDAEPTRSERSAVQRAIRKLEARGLVELLPGKAELCLRLPVSDEQREARHLREQMAALIAGGMRSG